MSDEPTATETPRQPTGVAWGDPIDETRKQELWARLRAWWATENARTDQYGETGPFTDEYLTGAEVFWLALCALFGPDFGPEYISDDEAQPPYEPYAESVASQEALDELEGRLRAADAVVGLDLSRLHLESAAIGGAHLEGAYLSNAHLEGAILAQASLQGAVLTAAHLEGANLRYARLDGANLTLANMNGVSLYGAHLEGANLTAAHLEGATLGEASLERASLDNAHLEGADLQRAVLNGASLFDAQLTGADLLLTFFDKQTELDGAILTDVRLDGVIFDNTNLTVVDWSLVPCLQEERRAQQARYGEEYLNKQGQRKDSSTRKRQYQAAARAYRRLAVALQANGMNEEAAGYAYRAQVCQRQVLRYSGWRAFGRWLFSGFLDALAGYGYAPGRTLLWYLAVIGGFAGAYFTATHGVLTFGLAPSQVQPLKWYEALILSVSAFHGRGFFQPLQSLGDPVAILAAVEAIIGLMIEISFIATFTQRFFGAK